MIESDSYINQIEEKLDNIDDEDFKKLIHRLIAERNYLKNYINIDALTGAYNRRILEHIREYSVICMIDIDNFKELNDTYGHDAGDDVLRIIAYTLIHHARVTDFIVRLGGDEFLVIFKDCKIETVKNRMTAVQNEVFRNNSLPCNLTLSIGISTYKEENTINDTIKEADTALYESKAYRNNTIVEYKPKELKLGIEKA